MSSGPVLSRVNDTAHVSVTLVKNGLPVTAKVPKVKFIRLSDSKFYNFGLNVWQTSSYVKNLTEFATQPGVYFVLFDQSVADPGTERDYLAVFTMNGAPADTFFGTVEYSFKKIAAPGDEMAVSAASIAAIRVAIWQHVVDGNVLGITAEEALDMVRKILNNRLELADGDTDNWKLYDDDDSTVLLEYDVKDKVGTPITIQPLAPARRTRGQ